MTLMIRQTLATLAVVLAVSPAWAELVIQEPAAGASWAVGSKHHLLWSGGAADTPVSIAVSSDGGTTYTPVAEKVPNKGRFLWTVPEQAGQSLKLRLTSGGDKAEAAVSITPSQQVKTYRWVEVGAQRPFAVRDGAELLSFQGKLWQLGGWNPSNRTIFPLICSNDVWNTTDGTTWTEVKPNSYTNRSTFDRSKDWEGRHTFGHVVYNDRMWIIGGDCNSGHYQKEVWSSADGKDWKLVAADDKLPWGPRALQLTFVHDGKIWLMGGQTMPAFAQGAPERFYRDIWTSTDGATWTEVKPKEPYWSERGMISGGVSLHGRMWILGGGTYDTPTTPTRQFLNDVWSSADGVSWRRDTVAAPWRERQYHNVEVFDGRMWVLGGYRQDSGNIAEVWYSADGVNWYEQETPWRGRHAPSTAHHANALWISCGTSNSGLENDVWKLVK
jgi:hypothetical protein